MKHWLLTAALICFGSTAQALVISSPALNITNQNGQTVFGINVSSFMASAALSGTFAGTSLGACVSGSTVSLTLPTGVTKIEVRFRGSARNDGLTNNQVVGVIVDGAYTGGETAAKGLMAMAQAVVNENENLSFTEVVSGLSAGSHAFCLGAFVGGGTSTIDSTLSVAKMTVVMMP